ncbi:MAG: hypothetical protein V3V99_07415 [candidate division Zixibacteria bacterium]
MEDVKKSLVVLFASLHLDEGTSPDFIKSYRDILREIAPSVICAELSPEQLDGTTTCHSKPEYAAAVLPIAQELGSRIVPIQMPTDDAREWERRLKSVYASLEKDPEMRVCLEYMKEQGKAELEGMLQIVGNPNGIEYFQTREYDILQVQPYYSALERIFPELATLYEEWNYSFLKRIETALADYRGEKFMIIVGGHHKYWLWDQLKRRDDIELHDLASYRLLQVID